MEVAVTDEKSVLVIGLEPTLTDFSHPHYAATGMDTTKVLAGLIGISVGPSKIVDFLKES